MRRALAWAALLLGVAPSASGHGTSKSYAELRVSGRVVEARVSFAAHDLAAATPGLDADGDGRVTAQELEDATAALGPHLSAQLAVVAGVERPERPCAPEPAEVRGLGSPVEEVQAELRYRCPTRVGALTLIGRFLPELEPPHLSVATVVGPGVEATHVFSVDAPELTLRFEVPSLGAELGAAARRVVQGLLTPAAVLLVLALAFAGGEGGATAVLLFGLGCAAAAGLPAFAGLAWARAVAIGLGAGLCVRPAPAVLRAGWGLAAGVLVGWGAAAGLQDAEAPVRWGALGAALLVSGAAAALARAAAARPRAITSAARTVAAALVAGGVASALVGGP